MQTSSSNSVSDTSKKNLKSQIDEASSHIAREFHDFVSDMEGLIKSTAHLSGDELEKAKAKLNERIAVARESVEEMGEGLVKRARKTAESTNAYVHEQPWNIIGAGAAVGLLIGYLLARRD